MTSPNRSELAMGAFAFGDEQWPGIAKLAEECGEVIQVIGKMMMVHGRREHWSGDLRAMLIDELADVRAAVTFVILHNLTPPERSALADRENAKLKKFLNWHDDFHADPPPPLRALKDTGHGE